MSKMATQDAGGVDALDCGCLVDMVGDGEYIPEGTEVKCPMCAKSIVVIEIRGGNVSEVYCNNSIVRYVVVDWDNISVGEDISAETYLPLPLKDAGKELLEKLEGRNDGI